MKCVEHREKQDEECLSCTDARVKELEALVGTIRDLIGCTVRNVDDITPEAHSHEIVNRYRDLDLQVGQSIAAERERCARLVEDWAKAYPVSMFGNPAHGKHGPTVDSCSAKALRESLPVSAQAIRGDDLDAKLGLCHEVSRWDGGEIYCYKPLPCATHGVKPKEEPAYCLCNGGPASGCPVHPKPARCIAHSEADWEETDQGTTCRRCGGSYFVADKPKAEECLACKTGWGISEDGMHTEQRPPFGMFACVNFKREGQGGAK